MAIIAYASANIAPIVSPAVDYIVDLSAVALPQAGLQIYGAAVDSTNAAATFTWQWYIMSKPTGSAVALATPTAQNTLVNAVDVWGNVRLFLVATNSATLVTSETDPLRAPSSAFALVRVLSATQGIQKPAAGERNWFDDLEVWADKIEAFGAGGGAVTPHTIVSHSDVATTTGADLDVLSGGGYADDPDLVTPNAANAFGNSLLHRHHGSDIDIATSAAPGGIYLDLLYAGPASTPRAMTEDYFMMTAHIEKTRTDLGVFEAIAKGTTVGGQVQPMVWFTTPPGIATGLYTIEDIIVVFNECPRTSTGYTFELVDAAMAASTAGRQAYACAAIAGTGWTLPANDAADINNSWGVSFITEGGAAGFGPFPSAGRGPIGFRCTASPADLAFMGKGLSVTLVCKRS